MIKESFISALRSVWGNKLRSFLTLLGIVIGIYAVVTLLSLARGVQKQTTEVINDFGPTLMIIMPGEDTGQGFNFAASFAPSTLFVQDVELLKEKADLLEKDTISYVTYTAGSLKKDDKALSGLPVGANPPAIDFFTFELIDGRTMTEEDIQKATKTIFITEKAAKAVNANIGDKVQLGDLDLTVEGIFRVSESGQLDPTAQDTMIIPATLAAQVNKSQQTNQIIIKAKDADSVPAAKEQVEKLLTKAHGSADFTVMLSSDLLEQFNKITDILTLMVVGIAAISLLVGGIGISNIMLVTVTERTKEIGIRKAVGATEGAILLQFLIEAVILTVIGALIAIAGAAATGAIIDQLSPLNPELNAEIILLAIGMATLTGIIFGLFPAVRAARKNPVEALRFE